MKSELVLSYLNDIKLRNDAETVLKDFLQLEVASSRSSHSSHSSPPIMPRYQISVRRPSFCWVHHCLLVHISTRCLKRGGRGCFCCQRDYNSCQPTTVCLYCATFLRHPIGLSTCCDLRCALIVRCCRFTTQSFVSLCLQRSILIWMTSDGAKHLCLSGGVVRAFVVLFCWHRLPILASAANTTELTSILLPARLRNWCIENSVELMLL